MPSQYSKPTKNGTATVNGCSPGTADGGHLEPIAVVGMSCRLPGSASDPQKLWDLLKQGRSAWGKTPKDRFNQGGFHDTSPDFKFGTTNTDGGNFLQHDVKAFDASFFGISPVEATAMDPQQRLVLEIAYEAFENAGLTIEQLSGSNTGVYVGLWASDYQEILTRDTDSSPTYQVTGVGSAIASNRVSYCFNLKGPSFTLDTGCSASLVALHQAVQSLRSGETDTSFVAGVNLLLDPQRYAYQSRLKMFSNKGQSFSFDHRALEANGYGRGEGCSGVVLMPLSLAKKGGCPIRAVIRNSVVNQDGRTQGISVPSASAQSAAIAKAYAQVGLTPYADYVEAHGTGTKVGDPIEAKAIAKILGATRGAGSPLPIGSLKANIGHLESAAGLTGLIKAVLMLEHNEIPPQANFEKANPEIDLEQLNLRIPLHVESGSVKRVSVNSFGYGGTNAHVILDSAASVKDEPSLSNGVHTNGNGLHTNGNGLHTNGNGTHTNGNGLHTNGWHMPNGSDADEPKSKHQLFVLSAASERSCQSMAVGVAEYLKSQSDTVDTDMLLTRLAHTLQQRSVLENRVGIIASGLDDLVGQLSELSAQPIPRSDRQTSPRIGFVFSGQGAQYPRMAKGLLGSWPCFTASMKRARRCLEQCGSSWDLFEELLKAHEESRMEDPCIAQPISTAVQISLVDALKDLGIIPRAVIGHSSGEIAAAYCAEAISFEDAMKVSYHRGLLTSELRMQNKGSAGAMMAVGASAQLVKQSIEQLGQAAATRIAVACYNSPSSVTVSGDEDVVTSLKQRLDEQDVWNRLLRTGGAAYHSPQMLQIVTKYYEALEDVAGSATASEISMASTVTGEELGDQAINKDYWVHNLVSPVRFTDALKKTCVAKDATRRVDLLLELGSHFQLENPIKQTLRSFAGEATKIQYAGTLKRGKDAQLSMLEMLRSLYLQKAPAAFWKVNAGFRNPPSPLTDLPPYPFDHSKSFWHESRVSVAYRNRQFLPHELLGTLIHDNNPQEPRWRCYLNLKDVPWLSGHVIQGQTIFPAAGYLAMALQAARQDTFLRSPEAGIDRFVLRNVAISQALVMDIGKTDLEISLSLRPQPVSARKSSKLWQEFRIFTTSTDNSWTEHCRGLLQVVLKSRVTSNDDGIALTQVALPTHAQHIQPKKFYHRAGDLGLNWGTPFDNLTDIRTTDGASISNASFVAAGTTPSAPYTIHPAVLDSVLYHSMMSILIFEDKITSPVVPTFIEKLIVAEQDPAQPLQEATCHSTRTKSFLTFDIGVFEKERQDKMVLQAWGVSATKLPDLSIGEKSNRDLCHVVDWVTYMPKTTNKHINEMCKSMIKDKSILAQHRALVALTLHYVKSSLASTSADDVAEGYQRHWFDWMQTLSDQQPDPALLSVAEADDSIVGQALKRLGPPLNELLRGTVHPLSLLTEGNLLNRLYSEERCARCITQISAYCGGLGRQNPNMKLLEIGAGTGSASLPILQALQSSSKVLASSYDFTDISPGFFPAAQELLADFANIVQYKTLNIEDGPEANGFKPHSYDVVIASNVIHATSRIDVVLDNARALLRPGGKLILMELTENRPYYNFVFGAFAGWWAGYDEGRKLSPLLSRPEWVQRLQKAGFVQNEPLFWDYPVADGGTITVFVSENPEPAPSAPPMDIDVVTCSDQSLGTTFTDKLQKRLWDRKVELSASSSPVLGDKLSIILPEVCDRVAWDVDGELFDALKARIIGSKAVMFVTRTANGKQDRPGGDWVYGFCRSIRQEHTSVRLISLEIGSDLEECLEPLVTILNSPTADLGLSNGDVELEFVEREGQLFVSRVRPEPGLDSHIRRDLGESQPEEAPFMNSRVMSAELAVPGVLDTIRWVDNPGMAGPLDPDHIKLQLCAASINFKDVLIASGQLEGITQMQNDCSGVVLEVGSNMGGRFKPGDRVCALYSQSYTNYPIVHGDCSHVIPEEMDLVAAASIPIVWATVYYCLVYAGKLKKGESILIHSAAGAVGQAAIMLARHIGADIFVTCGNDAKADLLVTEFGIAEDHVFSSRTTAFREKIQNLTGGNGVDVVLNSLSGEMFRESCNSLAPFGRFVEIGRKDLMENALMPMEFLLNNITFVYVDLAHVIVTRKSLAHKLLHEVMGLFASGAVEPVKLTKFAISQIGEAFRLIQADKHTGKVILTVEPEQKVQVVEQRPEPVQLHSDATYIVAGGLGGLGRRIVDWLAEKGARHIVIFSRSAHVDSEARSFLDRLGSSRVTVRVDKCDVTSEDSLDRALANLRDTMPRIRGLIQAAMVLHDVLLDDMTVEQWCKATSPKIRGTWNLHTLLPSDLDFFIMLSSVVSVVGNIGSSNYAAACSFQDGIAHYRQRLGLAAYSINVGAVIEAGYVSENPEVAATLRRNGLGNVTIAEFLSHLGHVLRNETGYCQSSIGLVPSGTERGLEAMYWTNDKKFAHLGRENQIGRQTAGAADDVGSILRTASTHEEALDTVRGAIVKQLATILALGPDEIISARSLDSYGVDSLVGVELRNWISAYLQVNLPLLVMWSTNSIDELAGIVTKGSRLVTVKVVAADEETGKEE
ncbi:Uu.00g052940.m01.CDS01 [Anthostomella pinea]|uniref:Uu.00g052940.m01.CDS01 n=1 Tax=Anthostomella pinea TaxID=933095 RepID=A0AAI8VWB9_9PEZI|nr:Uu.00g052940.m01.CDS01 [Anthostomella pinea]